MEDRCEPLKAISGCRAEVLDSPEIFVVMVVVRGSEDESE